MISKISYGFFLLLLMCISLNVYFFTRPNERKVLPPSLPSPKYVPDVIPYVLASHDVCAGGAVTAMMLVTSHAGNVAWRETLRRVYPTEELRALGVRRVFLLGVPRLAEQDRFTISYNSIVEHSKILAESRKYNDIVQGNFTEAYTFLPMKQVMGLRWAVSHCKNARYIIKIDDDSLVDIYRFLKALNSSGLEEAPRIMGYVYLPYAPTRGGDKYLVSLQEYNRKYYPKYVIGCLYATTPSTAAAILNFTSVAPYFRFEDVYVTGVLAERVGVEFVPICWETMAFNEDLKTCLLPDVLKKYECRFLVGGINGLKLPLVMLLKEHFKYCHTHICPVKDYLQRCTQT